MKNIIDSLQDPYRTADKTNLAGGKAWTQSNPLEQLAMTGTLGNSYYASTRDLVDGAVEVFEKAEASALASAIIKGRNDGFIRAANILGLVYLSKKDASIFKETFPQIVRTGNDMEDFIGMCRSVRGFGRSIKTAINTWLANSSEYYAIKYRRQLADAMRIAHPTGGDDLFKYIASYYSTTVIPEGYPQVQAFEKAKKLITSGEKETAKGLITEFDLDVGSLLGVGNTDGLWSALAPKMGVMMFLKYLNKLIDEDVLTMELLKSKITVANLKKAKVFPFRLYVAYQNVNNQKVQNYLAEVLDKYTVEYDWSSFTGSWAICPDISGSMSWGNFNNTKPSLIAGLFTGFFYKGIEDTEVIPWGSGVQKYNIPRADSVLTHIKNIENANGGGTNMEAPIIELISRKSKADNVVIITDSMEWGQGWLKYWKTYKKENPQAKAFLIRIDSYRTQSFDPATADKYGIYQIFGWNDNVVKYIEACI